MRQPLSLQTAISTGVLLALLSLAASPLAAQPFGAWLVLNGTDSYMEVPSTPALNPSSEITIEAWVAVSNGTTGEDCRSIIGKNYLQSYWVGQCNVGGQPTLRSYLKGLGSARDGGVLPRGKWTHIAVTFNGNRRKHYINGELVGDWGEPGALPSSSSPLRFGSDVSWNHVPTGALNQIRLWNVARTQSQIRQTINQPITTAQTGLVAVWPLSGGANELIGGYDGTLHGGTGFLTFPAALNCGSGSATTLCLQDRFAVSVEWRDFAGNTGSGTVVPGSTDTAGLFWFFSSDNWEMLVKLVDACTTFHHYWVFSAATTTVFYRVTVTDVRGSGQRIFFNYPHEPAVGIVDTASFSCP